jgi:hypothetical protein
MKTQLTKPARSSELHRSIQAGGVGATACERPQCRSPNSEAGANFHPRNPRLKNCTRTSGRPGLFLLSGRLPERRRGRTYAGSRLGYRL